MMALVVHETPAAVIGTGRPAAVRWAEIFLAFTGVIDLVAAVASVPAYRALSQGFRPALLDAGMDAGTALRVDSIARNGLLVAIGVSVVVGVVVLLLSLYLRRGSGAARLTTIVVCGAITLCLGGAAGLMSVSVGGDIDTAAVMRSSYPSWFVPMSAVLTALQVLGYLSVIVLLVLPVSARFFEGRLDPSGWIHHEG